MCRFVNTEFDDLVIAFYHGSTFNDSKSYSLGSIEDISSQESYKSHRSTVLYIHGFRESLSSESVKTVVQAFIKRNSSNILALDWGFYANGSYVTDAVPNMVKVFLSLLKNSIVVNFSHRLVNWWANAFTSYTHVKSWKLESFMVRIFHELLKSF